jgi:uncharacterized protein (DUF2384 family)
MGLKGADMSKTAGAPSTPPSESPDEFGVFSKICEHWSLTTDQQMILLGSPARSTFFKWKKEGSALSQDTRERISHIISIFKALEILFTDPNRADGWLRRPNSYFEGKAAIDVMLGGTMRDIYEVRAYVDAQRGG